MIMRKSFLFVVMAGIALCACGCGSDEAGKVSEQNSFQEAEDTELQNILLGSESTNLKDIETKTSDPGLLGAEAGQGGESEDGGKGFLFPAGDILIGVDMDMNEIIDELGEYQSVYSSPSCAGDGISYVYDYGSYEIETYPAEDGKDRIAYILLRDDMVSTQEGIDLSMDRESIISTYGSDYIENGDSLTYEKDGAKLNFIFENGEFLSIEYASSVLG